MKIFKNKVGRPSNKTLKIRKMVIVSIFAIVIMLIASMTMFLSSVSENTASKLKAETALSTGSNCNYNLDWFDHKGDVNNDNIILADDARLILRYSAKLENMTNKQICLADIDGDGTVTAGDARFVLRISAKLENKNSMDSGVLGSHFISPLKKYSADYLKTKIRYKGENSVGGTKYINIDIPSGNEVVAMESGKVDRVYTDQTTNCYGSCTGNASLGMFVRINHGNGLYTLYASLSKISVTNGQRVSQGETIGLSGNTGDVVGDTLHLELFENEDRNNKSRNPLDYIYINPNNNDDGDGTALPDVPEDNSCRFFGSPLPNGYKLEEVLYDSWNDSGKYTNYAVTNGTDVYAMSSGVVEEVKDEYTGLGKDLGNFVVINHNDEYYTLYGSLSKIDVKKGQTVSTRQKIGSSGDSGSGVLKPQIHIEVYEADKIVYNSSNGSFSEKVNRGKSVSAGAFLPANNVINHYIGKDCLNEDLAEKPTSSPIKQNSAVTGKLDAPVKQISDFWTAPGNARCFPYYNSGYGGCSTSTHSGVDLSSVSSGTEVYAMDGGVVSEVGNYKENCYTGADDNACPVCKGELISYGIYVVIDHKNGYSTAYAHLSKRNVNIGDSVSQGDPIGLSGNTGCSSGSHLHIELRGPDRKMNAAKFLPGSGEYSGKSYLEYK